MIAMAIPILIIGGLSVMHYFEPAEPIDCTLLRHQLRGTDVKHLLKASCTAASCFLMGTHGDALRHVFFCDDAAAFREHVAAFREKYEGLVRLGQPPLPWNFDKAVMRIAGSNAPTSQDANVLLRYLWALHSGKVTHCDFYGDIRSVYLEEARKKVCGTN